MKRLYLLRHAKAAAPGPGLDDHDRALTVRGMHDAAVIARYLRRTDCAPDLLLVSTAARTRQTADLVLRETGGTADYRPALYLAEPGRILAAVQGAPRAAAVMVIGHNPGLEELAAQLAREPVRRRERARRDGLEEKFPTAALAVLDFDVAAWRDIRPGEGKLVDFVRPKDV